MKDLLILCLRKIAIAFSVSVSDGDKWPAWNVGHFNPCI